MGKIIIKKFRDDPPVIRVVIICNYCGEYLQSYNYNPATNLFVCPSCTRSWFTIIPLNKYRKLKKIADFKQQQKIQKEQDIIKQNIQPAQQQVMRHEQKPQEKNEAFEAWVADWQKDWDKKRI